MSELFHPVAPYGSCSTVHRQRHWGQCPLPVLVVLAFYYAVLAMRSPVQGATTSLPSSTLPTQCRQAGPQIPGQLFVGPSLLHGLRGNGSRAACATWCCETEGCAAWALLGDPNCHLLPGQRCCMLWPQERALKPCREPMCVDSVAGTVEREASWNCSSDASCQMNGVCTDGVSIALRLPPSFMSTFAAFGSILLRNMFSICCTDIPAITNCHYSSCRRSHFFVFT